MDEMDWIDPKDLPTQMHEETYAELLTLAQAGNFLEFFALCPESGNPDAAEALNGCLRVWIQCREALGLSTGIRGLEGLLRPPSDEA